MDMDIIIRHYDTRLHYIFDSVSFYYIGAGFEELINGIFLSKVSNAIQNEFVRDVKERHLKSYIDPEY